MSRPPRREPPARPTFDEHRFERDLAAAQARCSVLSLADAAHFVEHGYVIVKDAFPRSFADHVCQQAWHELASDWGVSRADPATWQRQMSFGMPGYARTEGSDRRLHLATGASRAFEAQCDLVGGAARLPGSGTRLHWKDVAIANLGPSGFPPGTRNRLHLPGWHKDGWHFRHFLDSPEQGLLVVPIFSDILPQSGGTELVTDSIPAVARLLAAHPEGLHPDSVQGAGYLVPGLIDQCSQFVELTGSAGDVALLHPFMLHRVVPNPSPRPRFIANHALVTAEPMQFDRTGDSPYSLVELAVLRALAVNRLPWTPRRERTLVTPGPYRDDTLRASERAQLEAEMRDMALAGYVTPDWGGATGYDSNRAFA